MQRKTIDWFLYDTGFYVDHVQQNIFDYQLCFSQIHYAKPGVSVLYTCLFKKLWNVAEWWQNLTKMSIFIQILSNT